MRILSKEIFPKCNESLEISLFLTKLSKLDEFDEEVIRYLIDYVLVYDNEHIEIRWNFDDFQAG